MNRRATYIPTDRERRLGVIAFYLTVTLAVAVWGLIIAAILLGWTA